MDCGVGPDYPKLNIHARYWFGSATLNNIAYKACERSYRVAIA
jgi:hypothetical protein